MAKDDNYSDRADRRGNRRLLSAFVNSGFGDDHEADHLVGGFQRRQRVVDKAKKSTNDQGAQLTPEQRDAIGAERAALEVQKVAKDPAAAANIARLRVALEASMGKPQVAAAAPAPAQA